MGLSRREGGDVVLLSRFSYPVPYLLFFFLSVGTSGTAPLLSALLGLGFRVTQGSPASPAIIGIKPPNWSQGGGGERIAVQNFAHNLFGVCMSTRY